MIDQALSPQLPTIDPLKATRLFSLIGLVASLLFSSVFMLSGYSELGLSTLFLVAVFLIQLRSIQLNKHYNQFKLAVTLPSLIGFFTLQTYLHGIVAAFWFYPLLMIIFIITSVKQATLIAVALFAINLPVFFSQLDTPTALRLSISLSLIGIFSAVFLNIITMQQKRLFANEQKRQEYLSNSSHELKTPLSTMLAKIEAMQDGIRPVNDEQVESLLRSNKQLSELVADLKLLTQADVKELPLNKEYAAIDELIQEAIDSFLQAHEDSQVSITFDDQHRTEIHADPVRIRQVLNNLFLNSLKYSETPARIVVSLYTELDRVVIKVEDTPPSVDENSLNKLFERFYRDHKNRSDMTVGSGLGLAIAKTLIELHDGEIHAFPSSIGGLGIQIHLPVAKDKTRSL